MVAISALLLAIVKALWTYALEEAKEANRKPAGQRDWQNSLLFKHPGITAVYRARPQEH